MSFFKDKIEESRIRKEVRNEIKHETFVNDTMRTFDDNINELEKEKRDLMKEAQGYLAENFEEGYRVTLKNYKKLYFTQRHIKLCRSHFKLFLQDLKILKIDVSFATALKVVSDGMIKMTRGSVNPEDIMVEVRMATKKSKEATEFTNRLGKLVETSFANTSIGFSDSDDKEIDKMFDSFLAADESQRDSAEKELNKQIELQLKKLDGKLDSHND